MNTLGGAQEMTVVSEPGLYKLIMTSRKPAAKRFDRWVRHDVLPAIRKTGNYGNGSVDHMQMATIIVEGFSKAIAPLGVRLEDTDAKIDRIEQRQDAMAEDIASIKFAQKHSAPATRA